MNYRVLVKRAQMAMEQRRYEIAERTLRQAIALEPELGEAYSLLAVVLSDTERAEEAVEAARRGIALDPDDPFAHYALGLCLISKEKWREAAEAIDAAIQRNPLEPAFYAAAAQVHLCRQKWEPALAAAERGLAFDPDHTDCTNIRAMALTRLRRVGDAGDAVRAALAVDPHDADTHANMGWTLLHEGKHKQAAEHFRESLRLDSNNAWARDGIVEALKARHLLYRLVLRYFLWVSAIPVRIQLLACVGVIVLVQLMVRLPDGGPIWVIGVVLMLAYVLFVFTFWTSSPLFDLLLRFNRLGRIALTDHQRRDTNWMALFLVLDAILVSGPLITGFRTLDIIYYLVLILAVGVTLRTPREARRKLALGITLGLFAAAFIYWYRFYIDSGLPLDLMDSDKFEAAITRDPSLVEDVKAFMRRQETLQTIVIWGSVAMTWFSPVLASKR